MKTKFVVMLLAALVLSASASAGLFTEDFESPVVEGYVQGTTPSGWVRASNGYGSGKHGLNNLGDNQVYSFRYTNSGITSAEGVIGALDAALTYTVSFDVVADQDITRLKYEAALMVFDAGVARNDVRETLSGSVVLGEVTGNAPDDGSWATISFEVLGADFASLAGKDLAVRFKGATSSANIDNVSVSAVPEPATLALLGLGGLLLRRKR